MKALRIFVCGIVIGISGMGLSSLTAGPRLAPASADPARFSISMPDYHRVGREIWMGEVNTAWLQLQSIADEAVKAVSDSRLTIDQRSVIDC
ncbi:MAG: hypothetical protein JWP89_461 [Schlesneria sp.]|nr:hypothetical protein [Schlesneria sp.]